MYKVLTTISAVLVLSMLFAAGCESDAQTGALLGSAVGAGVGALAGGNTEATLIGAGVGGGAGYIIGNESDKKKQDAKIESVRDEMNYTTDYITNSNGSMIPVRLRKSGPDYIGPKGELYRGLPTEDQLRPVYGF